MRAALALTALLTSTGCAALFQDRLRGGVAAYDGRSEPQCTTSRGWAALDGVLAGLSLLGVVAIVPTDDPIDNRGLVVASGVVDVAVHGISAIVGASWASDCRRAYDAWNNSPAGIAEQERRATTSNDPRGARAFWCSRDICVTDRDACGDACTHRTEAWCAGGESGFVCSETRNGCLVERDRRRDWSMGECVKRRAELAHLPGDPPKRKPPMAPSSPPTPRGFFCSTSPDSPGAGFCTREKADCQRARDAAIAAVADLAECQLVEVAFCHVAGGAERCAPTMETCAERSKSALGVTVACEERK